MSTRATIKIEGISYAKIYKHSDGYPENTLPWLEKFNKEFSIERGYDPEYKFAQLLRSSIRDGKEFGLGQDRFLGWGVVSYNENMGENYEYILKTDGTIMYKQVDL